MSQTDNSIATFFSSSISERDFVHVIRKFIRATITQHLHNPDGHVYRQELSEGYYWLTEFVDKLECNTETT